MPKIKMPSSSPSIDMTPMVDLAFLLVTFFMLAAQFKPEELVAVEIPSSHGETKVPKENVIAITISTKGNVLINVSGEERRRKLLESMAAKYKVSLTQDEYEKFGKMGMFGVPMENMKDYLATASATERQNFPKLGIPTDSLNNQFRDWMYVTLLKYGAEKVRPTITIKADNGTEYKYIQRVIEGLRENKANTYSLITNYEAAPAKKD